MVWFSTFQSLFRFFKLRFKIYVAGKSYSQPSINVPIGSLPNLFWRGIRGSWFTTLIHRPHSFICHIKKAGNNYKKNNYTKVIIQSIHCSGIFLCSGMFHCPKDLLGGGIQVSYNCFLSPPISSYHSAVLCYTPPANFVVETQKRVIIVSLPNNKIINSFSISTIK